MAVIKETKLLVSEVQNVYEFTRSKIDNSKNELTAFLFIISPYLILLP